MASTGSGSNLYTIYTRFEQGLLPFLSPALQLHSYSSTLLLSLLLDFEDSDDDS